MPKQMHKVSFHNPLWNPIWIQSPLEPRLNRTPLEPNLGGTPKKLSPYQYSCANKACAANCGKGGNWEKIFSLTFPYQWVTLDLHWLFSWCKPKETKRACQLISREDGILCRWPTPGVTPSCPDTPALPPFCPGGETLVHYWPSIMHSRCYLRIRIACGWGTRRLQSLIAQVGTLDVLLKPACWFHKWNSFCNVHSVHCSAVYDVKRFMF